MIPKKIHYCWFGGNKKPDNFRMCLKSWKKFCPDYEIIEWNESNFSFDDMPLYVKQAYENKKYAFATDYIRLRILYDNGGIYMDTDVELIKPIDNLLCYNAYFGLDGGGINTGLGFGSVAGNDLLLDMMKNYESDSFILPSGEFDRSPCSKRDTAPFLARGLEIDGKVHVIGDNIAVFPQEYFCPKDIDTDKIITTPNTYSIHHFNLSWSDVRQIRKKAKKQDRIHRLTHLPNRLLSHILGSKYESLKRKIKR